jgi:hypothetical protein
MPFELLVGAAVGAAVASPTGRRWMRRGLVYGLAGALTAYDRAASLAKGAAQGVRDGVDALRAEAATANATPDNNGHTETTPTPSAREAVQAGTPPG